MHFGSNGYGNALLKNRKIYKWSPCLKIMALITKHAKRDKSSKCKRRVNEDMLMLENIRNIFYSLNNNSNVLTNEGTQRFLDDIHKEFVRASSRADPEQVLLDIEHTLNVFAWIKEQEVINAKTPSQERKALNCIELLYIALERVDMQMDLTVARKEILDSELEEDLFLNLDEPGEA